MQEGGECAVTLVRLDFSQIKAHWDISSYSQQSSGLLSHRVKGWRFAWVFGGRVVDL